MAGTSVGSHSHKRPHSLAKIEFIPRSLEQISCYFRPACAMLLLCQDKPPLVDVKPKEHSQGRNPSRTCAWHGPDAQSTCVSLAFFLNGQSCFANAACGHIRSFPPSRWRKKDDKLLGGSPLLRSIDRRWPRVTSISPLVSTVWQGEKLDWACGPWAGNELATCGCGIFFFW
jgi:hypothetical protein